MCQRSRRTKKLGIAPAQNPTAETDATKHAQVLSWEASCRSRSSWFLDSSASEKRVSNPERSSQGLHKMSLPMCPAAPREVGRGSIVAGQRGTADLVGGSCEDEEGEVEEEEEKSPQSIHTDHVALVAPRFQMPITVGELDRVKCVQRSKSETESRNKYRR